MDRTTLPEGSVPDHERIRRDAAAHPERTYSEHIEASRAILGEEYLETLRRVQAREGQTGATGRDRQPGRGPTGSRPSSCG